MQPQGSGSGHGCAGRLGNHRTGTRRGGRTGESLPPQHPRVPRAGADGAAAGPRRSPSSRAGPGKPPASIPSIRSPLHGSRAVGAPLQGFARRACTAPVAPGKEPGRGRQGAGAEERAAGDGGAPPAPPGPPGPGLVAAAPAHAETSPRARCLLRPEGSARRALAIWVRQGAYRHGLGGQSSAAVQGSCTRSPGLPPALLRGAEPLIASPSPGYTGQECGSRCSRAALLRGFPSSRGSGGPGTGPPWPLSPRDSRSRFLPAESPYCRPHIWVPRHQQ